MAFFDDLQLDVLSAPIVGVIPGFSFWTAGNSSSFTTPTGVFALTARVRQPLPEDTIQFEAYVTYVDRAAPPYIDPWASHTIEQYNDYFLCGGFPADGANPYTQQGAFKARGTTSLTLGEHVRTFAVLLNIQPPTWSWDGAQLCTVSDTTFVYRAQLIHEDKPAP